MSSLRAWRSSAGGARCAVCQKAFKSRDSLRNHRALHEGRTVCELCGRVFSTLSNLSEHRRNFHGGSRTSLAHHMGLHRGETRCPVCQRVFSRREHMRTHLPCARGGAAAAAGAARLHVCRTCGRTFGNRSSLSHHRTVHRGQTTCHLCGRTLSRKVELRRHMRVMHGFPCREPGCDRRFTSRPRLSDHGAWHRGETRCNLCSRVLTSKHNLHKHLLMVHSVVVPKRPRGPWPSPPV
ncbi:zinc finger protein 354A-like [Pollicipes pollicipes]|uniref:zinc finger protein 354A-like n=1 Tax=Pollicipes pollicipes TaxID=41117 RepID=UPI00188499DE|nr:zinc finger protein 354A-like [Pollicipes pollicipes]